MDWSAQGGSGPQIYQEVLVAAMFAPFADRLVEAAGVTAGKRVLDVACGTGAVSRAAARRAGSTGAVTGVDLGPPMLEVARSQPHQQDAAPIVYLEGSADAPPVPAGSFDVATCQQGLQFFPDRAAALGAIREALRPGGTLAVATWTDLEGSPLWSALAATLGRHVSEDAASMMRSPWALADLDELEGLVRDAGFSGVQGTRECLEASFPSGPEIAGRILMAGPVGTLFAAAPAAAQDAVAADIAETLAPLRRADGTAAVPITTNVVLAT